MHNVLRFCVKQSRKVDDSTHLALLNQVFSTVRREFFLDYIPEKGIEVKSVEQIIFDKIDGFYAEYAMRPTESALRRELQPVKWGKNDIDRVDDVLAAVFQGSAPVEEFIPSLKHLQSEFNKTHVIDFVGAAVEFNEFEDMPEALVALGVRLSAATREDVQVENGPATMQDLLASYYQQLKSGKPGSLAKISWPFPTWQNNLGAIGRGEIIMFAAQFNSGKSFVMHEMLYQFVKQGYNCVAGELEMLYQQVIDRLVAEAAGLTINEVRDIFEQSEAVQKKARRALRKIMEHGTYNNLLMLSTRDARTPEGLRRSIKLQMGSIRPDIIVLDAYGLMSPSGRTREAGGWESKEALITELKTIAKELECVIITAVHLNRENEVRFQSALDYADCVIELSMSDEDPYIPPKDGEPSIPGVIQAYIKRGRTIPAGGVLALEVDFAKGTVRDRPFSGTYSPPATDAKDDIGANKRKKKQNGKREPKPYDGSQF